jgi:hypothetical protein
VGLNAAFLASVPRAAPRARNPVTLADSFAKQWLLIECRERAICVLCSRRAGKTEGLKLRTHKRSDERAGHRTLYIHHTRLLAKQQFFEPLIESLKAKGVEFEANQTELWIKLHNGSLVQAVGCDDGKDVGRKLGYRWDDIIIDECQEFADEILTKLVDKTILPTLIDRAGTLTLSGTPPNVEAGLWWTAIHKSAFCQLRWTLLDNPHIERADIESTMALRGFVIDFEHPEKNDVLIQREIFGLPVIDQSTLLYCYQKGINDWALSGPPLVDSKAWRFAMGVDIGGAREGNDKDACVVLGWLNDDPEHTIYERECWEAGGQDSEAFCARVLDTFNRWRPMASACADTGGAGANKMLEHLAPRLGGLTFTAKPTSVETSLRLLQDEFRSGRFRVNPLGLIARDAKICTNPETYHSDIMAACRYAHHGAYHYLNKPAPPPEDDDARRKRQWLQKQKMLKDPWRKGMSGWAG